MKAAVSTVLQVARQLDMQKAWEHEIWSGSITSTILSAIKWYFSH